MRYLAAIFGVAAVLYLLHRVALYAERRGWIYYRSKPPRGAGSLAAMEVMKILDPTIEHVIEIVRSETVAPDEHGEPPAGEE